MDSSLSSDKTLFGLSDQDINCSDEIQDENESLVASALTIFGISDQCCSTIDSRYDDLSNDMPGTDNVDHDMPSCVVRSSTPKKQTRQSNVSPNFTLSPIEIPPTGSPIRPSRYISTKRKLSMSRDPLHVLKAKCGCGNLCIQAMSISTILGCEQKLKHLKESEQKSFICEEIAKHSRLKKSHLQRMATFEFIVDGKLVCETAWCLAHNVSSWRFRQCKQMYTRGLTVAKHGNVGHGKVTEKTKVALSWMRSLFTSIGEYMPHKTEVHLPRIYTKKMLYQRMIKELRSYHREQSISYEHFTRIWSQHLPEFRISTKNSDFTVCSTCTELDEAFYRSASDDTKTRVSKLKEEHMSQVEMERNAYYDARMKSRKSPSELSCLIIDGMDQSKTDVPHLVISDKDTKPLARLPVHITGVIFHTDDPEGKRPYVHYDIKQFPHDTNITIHCLLMCLEENKDKLGESLFLQMDNCYRENKNRFLLTFGETLVGLDIFRQVVFHFLPVGHTHEDVDQMFSRISAALRQTNCYTLPELERCIASSYTPSITVKQIMNVQNMKTEMLKLLSGGMKGQSRPHWFRFSKTTDGKTQMHYRLWASDSWEPQEVTDGRALHCLKIVPQLQTTVDWVKPSLEKTDVPRLQKDLPDSYGNRIPPAARDWWTEYIANIFSYENVPNQSEVWRLARIKKSAAPIVSNPQSNDDIESIQQRVHITCPQLTIAGQQKSRGVTEVDDLSGLIQGMLVAVHLEDTTSRPYIGRVLNVDTDSFTLEWLRGSWNKEWKPWRIGVGRNIRTSTDTLPFTSVLLYGFELTPKGKLTKSTVENLQSLYSELDL